MSKLQIIGAPMSNFVWSVRLAAVEKGIEHEVVPAGPHAGEPARISPTGKIPVLKHGEVELFESAAIAVYIDRAFPGPALFGQDAIGAALAHQWVSYENTVVDTCLIRRYALGYVFPGTPDGSPDRARIDAALADMPKVLAALDRAVAATGHFVGKALSYADLNVVPMLYYATRFPEGKAEMAKHPALSAFLERMMARPSFEATKPPPPPPRK